MTGSWSQSHTECGAADKYKHHSSIDGTGTEREESEREARGEREESERRADMERHGAWWPFFLHHR